MKVTNILAHLLVNIKMGYINRNIYVYTPYNSLCIKILTLLFKDGLITNYRIDVNLHKIKITLKYYKNTPLITEFMLISKPSFSKYLNYKELLDLKKKYDYFYISTSVGILSSTDFFKNHTIGGQILFGCNLNCV